ncbi:hypothetical protein HWV62_22036 [Athelia sp. TMB]|nr:hypothetical protein HWV62_22036 [Athelia sp. TMB]
MSDERPVRPRRPTREVPAVPGEDPAVVLTPLRAHYLKKSLIQLQFDRELDDITSSVPNNVSTLSYLGPPFTPPPKEAVVIDLPFLRYIFRQFVLTFPFMASAPKDFYSDKLQPFVASVLARNLSPISVLADPSEEGSDQATRLKLLAKIQRNLSLFVGAGTKLIEPEEVVRLTQADLDRLETIAEKRIARAARYKDVFEVNIISVRAVTDKGRMRSRVHEEFIIRTRRSNCADVFVSRRYGDFKTLSDELRKHHPEEDAPPPPLKDKTAVNASGPPPPSYSRQSSFASRDSDDSTAPYSPTFASPHGPSRLAREKNRLTLRAYLHSLMASSTIASSPVLRSFLLMNPTTLTREELEDAKRREDADRVREDGRKRFAKEIAQRVEGLREAVKSVKGDIMGRDGLTHIFATVKECPHVEDLPENYKAVLEWARISLAATVFQSFVAADSASETLASLKRIHGLMPYFMLKAALKISNPMGMIRSMLDLFMAQPFGGRSLLQRMFTSSLTEEVKVLEADIEAVKEKVDDPIMCEKVRQFVYAPREIQDLLKADAAEEKMNILTVVLRSGDEPVLSRAQMQRVNRAHRAHNVYAAYRGSLDDSDDDDGPEDDDAWLYEDLKVLTLLYSRLRDREQIIDLIFEGVTAELLKDILTIFYAPLAEVYRAASIGDSISDMQAFINDLIRTVENVEELNQQNPQRTVQTFIDLIQRHEQAFYNFVHKVHSKGEGLFDRLMRWVELFLTVVREGLGKPISLEFLLPHTGQARKDIIAEVDAVALYHYKLKVVYEDKLRRRFGKVQTGSDADAEDEATQALVQGVVGEISFGDLVSGDAADLAAEDTDESEGDSSEYETATDSDESSEEESSEEEPPLPAKSLSTTAADPSAPPLPPKQHHHQHHVQHKSPPNSKPRPRSLSLRTSKSMMGLGRRSHDSAPPVPPLPGKGPLSPLSPTQKPLPPSPMVRKHSSTDNFATRTQQQPASPQRRRMPMSPVKSRKRKGRKASEQINAPELQHIPQLLPIFQEMMRPLLRPQQT